MPKSKQKARWPGKPSPTRKPKVTKAPPKVTAPTVEESQAAIIACFDQAEQLMMKSGRPAFRLNNPFEFKELSELRKQYDKVFWELERAMQGGRVIDYGRDSMAEPWVKETFRDPAGAIPRWSRTGSFVLWLDYLPVLVTWSGILSPDLTAVAVDPSLPFIRNPQVTGRPKDVAQASALPSAGYLGLGTWFPMPPKWTSVLDLARHSIADIGNNLLLRPLTEDAKKSVRNTLASEPWIAEAVKRGPGENRMPLPHHLAAIQQTLFG